MLFAVPFSKQRFVEDMRGALAHTLKSLEPYIQPLVVKSRLKGANGR